MNRPFISVSSKLLVLILTILMVIGALYSWFSLSKLEADFVDYQEIKKSRAQQLYDTRINQLTSQITVWLESFAGMSQSENDFELFADTLKEQYFNLQMHFNVDDIWLTKEDESLFATAPITDFVKANTNAVTATQQPLMRMYCFNTCQQLISLPVMNAKGEIAVVTITASLVDVLFSLNNLLNTDVALVTMPSNKSFRLTELNVLSTSNQQLSNNFKRQDRALVKPSTILDKGDFFEYQEQTILVNFIELGTKDSTIFAVTLFEDVSSFREGNLRERNQFLFSVFVIFIAVALLIYMVIAPFTSRLIKLSEALPKLAKREFAQFRALKLKRNRVFDDEFDIVVKASSSLSLDLEQLNLEVEQKTKELENIAMYDLLTGLPNRNMLNYVLRKNIAKLGYSNNKIAVLFLDLDDFKKVNDSHGHNEGDKLLIEAANRVRSCVNDVDLACRFGGDEFVLVLGEINEEKDAIEVANAILERFRMPIRINSSVFYVSTSIGVVICDSLEAKADDLISQADIAMYEAKDAGGGSYHVFHQDMYHRVAHRVFMEGEVRQALLKQQFSLALQPQFEAKTNKLHGFEALLRWKHPERGMIAPDDFIPLLENSEHMIELGYWVIRRCFELVTVFKALGHRDIKLAINLSAGQFVDPELGSFLSKLVDEFKLSPSHFELELTEQTLVKDIDRTIQAMEELKALGFSFAIDDFGTGYSSLAYIKKMPVDVIKIDKSFVFGMLDNKADHQIIMSTIAMVKNLELTVVAEGVESSAQLRALADNGCDYIQGYYFSKPIPESEVFDFVANHIDKGYWRTSVVPL